MSTTASFRPSVALLRWRLKRGALATLACLALWAGGCLQGATRTGGAWIAPGDDEIRADSPPAPENTVFSLQKRELRLAAAANETLGLQIAVAGGSLGRTLTVHFTDLSGPAGALRAPQTYRVYRAHYVVVERFASWRPEHADDETLPTRFPDKLAPWEAPRGGGPLPVGAAGNQIIWVDLHVPPATPPGVYRGALTLGPPAGGPGAAETRCGAARPPASAAFTCEVVLEVLPVALPLARSVSVVCRIDPRDLLRAHLAWPAAAAEQTRLLPDEPGHADAVALVSETFRLFQSHRLNPVLWASFPKFRPVSREELALDWDAYDGLVGPWLDGTAFDDQTPLDVWLAPVSLDYPSAAQNGGLGSPAYARVLASYLAAVEAHFAERDWLARSAVRPAPPAALDLASVQRSAQAAAAVQAAGVKLPFVAHLPARSLRGLGWIDAPPIDLAPGAWATPAMWLEPSEAARQMQAGRRVWSLPDEPPYSGSLAIEAPPNDARSLAWLAYRYGLDGLWIEHAADGDAAAPRTVREPWRAPPLVYPGAEFGLRDRPTPSMRLKRLFRGVQDYELLKLLEQNGQALLARRVSEQVIRYGLTDAARENLLATRPAGWSRQPFAFELARELLLTELAGEAAGAVRSRVRNEWGVLFSAAERVGVEVDGARLVPDGESVAAQIVARMSNDLPDPLAGEWSLAQPPPGWAAPEPVPADAPAQAARVARLTLRPLQPAYNAEGAYPFTLRLDAPSIGFFEREGRLAFVLALPLDSPLRIDGRLDDWPLAQENGAGDFRLVRGGAERERAPTLPTQAFVALDDERLYVGVRCETRLGERPLWTADNVVPIDGAIPWEQDLVELLFDPRAAIDGSASDLYCLQIKPSGVVVAQKGCRTQPPIGLVKPWTAAARVAVTIGLDAWVVEAAIPLEAFGAEGRTNRLWGLNITRLDARRGEYSSWSGARGHAYRPESLGSLVMPWTPPAP